MIDLATVEALLDMGLDVGEAAVELGCPVHVLNALLDHPEVTAAPARPRAPAFRSRRGRSQRPAEEMAEMAGVRPGVGSRGMDSRRAATPPMSEEMSNIVKIAGAAPFLVTWAGQDDMISRVCDDLPGAGRMVPWKIGGRMISRAGLVRLLAEELCEKQTGIRLIHAEEKRVRAMVGFAKAMVLALVAVHEKTARETAT